MITVLIIILCVLIVVCIVLSSLYCFLNKILIGKTEIQSFHTESDLLKVAVISDTQLPPTKEDLENNDTYLKNLKKTLNVIKNNNVDMILFAGDIGDLGTYFAFETYENTIDEVFGDNRPIVQTVMGNHDFWHRDAKTATNHIKAFKEVTGKSPWTHYVVNGYHFIGASPDCGSMERAYNITSKWLDKELEKASADSDGKPIFVLTHNQPKGTCYGSDEWGDTSLNKVLEKHPNVVLFGGHSHYSILDERTIWQGEYTVIQTQSISYTELESGKENGTVPKNADATPMGYIMEFSNDAIDIHRINFADGNMGYEEKPDMIWSFSLPYKNDGKYAFEPRIENNKIPIVTNTTGTISTNNDKVILSFAAGTDDDFVHSYKIVIDDKDTKYFFSDFYNGIDNMKNTVELEMDNDGSKHNYKIYAVDSWGKESENYIRIENN